MYLCLHVRSHENNSRIICAFTPTRPRPGDRPLGPQPSGYTVGEVGVEVVGDGGEGSSDEEGDDEEPIYDQPDEGDDEFNEYAPIINHPYCCTYLGTKNENCILYAKIVTVDPIISYFSFYMYMVRCILITGRTTCRRPFVSSMRTSVL